MGNKATSVSEQIEILEKRGMEFIYERDKVEELLLDIGYYRLGFYWHPFEINNKEHYFKKGTTFKNVVELYYLDFDLRNLLTKYLTRIELHFKSKLIYLVSNKYKDSPTWFVDKQVINNNFIINFDKIYTEKFIKYNKTIKNHHEKYINEKYAPAWKTIEFLTFGINLNIYKNLKDESLKEEIANSFGILSVKKFQNFMDTIVLIRNTCAHGDVLYDLRIPKGIASIPEIKVNNEDRSSLIACLEVILFFLGKISINRKNDLKNDLDAVFINFKNNEVIKKIIIEKIKYKFL